ncbi:alginate O-acetyltransferase [Legionella sp. km535]|uniref:alginate O-acetyltransferase AlgX-related protein n=1 Tax=Legionella sp. km535 TaxID=2498107 RepID=UPI000F8F19B1|nr:alginate O-acetyltransferase [Legionella sp. km535]RUR19433.1 alginate O-acetyltransferase [Legionella sp. km535]
MNVLSRYSDRFLIIAFILIISIPGIGLFFEKQADEIRVLFNRDPYPLPPFNITKLGRTDFKGIENWFIDRALLITTLSKITSNIVYKLGTSIKPGQALLGKDDWLFLGNDFSATIDQYTGKNQPTEEEIYTQLSILKHMSKIASQYSVPFLVALAPDKHEIYPEYLPDNIQKGRNKNRLELLEEGMKANGIDFVSLKQKELAAKNTLGKQYGDLYLKGDSHWNYLGAYVAYQAISEQMQLKGIKINPISFKFIPQQTTSSDLTNFLQLTHIKSNNPLPDTSSLKIDLTGKEFNGSEVKIEPLAGSPNILNAPYQIINKALDTKQTCLLIGDSFSEALGFYFHNDFYNTIRIHPGNKTWSLATLIEMYHPDVIVYEKVQRDLIFPMPNFQLYSEPVQLSVPENTADAQGELEQFNISSDRITTYGWAYLPNQDAGLNEVYLKFTDGKQSYFFSMTKLQRQSVNLAFKHDGMHLNMAGFSGTILRKDLPNGTYQVSLVVVNDALIGEKKYSQNYTLS